jgi:hypothetical protein
VPTKKDLTRRSVIHQIRFGTFLPLVKKGDNFSEIGGGDEEMADIAGEKVGRSEATFEYLEPVVPVMKVPFAKTAKVTRGGASSSASSLEKRTVPAPDNPAPWKKSMLNQQLRSLTLKPTVKFDPHVQVSTVPSPVMSAVASGALKPKPFIPPKTNLSRLMVPAASTKSNVDTLSPVCVSISRPVEGILHSLS